MRKVAAAEIIARETGGGATLGGAPLGFVGRIRAVRAPAVAGGLSAAELERRLIELGLVEGARVEVLHQGPFGGDPIAVRVNEATIALRRRDAALVTVEAAPPPAAPRRPAPRDMTAPV